MIRPLICFVFACFFLTGCHSPATRLSRVFVVDTQGFSQTVTTPTSLERFEKIDFTRPQPYQKVMRTWKSKGKEGDISILTSYYPSGQLMQYLEGQSGRAFGLYKEWHENGHLKVLVRVSGGTFDLGEAAESTWIFDGLSEAFDEDGKKQAEIFYVKGSKEDQANFYYSSGALWQRINYQNNELHGPYTSWYESGAVYQEANYLKDLLDGQCVAWWPNGQKQSQELYKKDKLQEATYWDISGKVVAQVSGAKGERAIFANKGLAELQTIEAGEVLGWVGYFDEEGQLWHEVNIKNGLKDGQETFFYPIKEGKRLPKIIMQWVQGTLHGSVRTWFATGQLESERQVVQEQSHGPYVAYYPDGSLRVLEEYRKGKLVDGQYFSHGNLQAVSRVIAGQGTATLFDERGHLIKEITYRDGEPCLYPSGHE